MSACPAPANVYAGLTDYDAQSGDAPVVGDSKGDYPEAGERMDVNVDPDAYPRESGTECNEALPAAEAGDTRVARECLDHLHEDPEPTGDGSCVHCATAECIATATLREEDKTNPRSENEESDANESFETVILAHPLTPSAKCDTTPITHEVGATERTEVTKTLCQEQEYFWECASVISSDEEIDESRDASTLPVVDDTSPNLHAEGYDSPDVFSVISSDEECTECEEPDAFDFIEITHSYETMADPAHCGTEITVGIHTTNTYPPEPDIGAHASRSEGDRYLVDDTNSLLPILSPLDPGLTIKGIGFPHISRSATSSSDLTSLSSASTLSDTADYWSPRASPLSHESMHTPDQLLSPFTVTPHSSPHAAACEHTWAAYCSEHFGDVAEDHLYFLGEVEEEEAGDIDDMEYASDYDSEEEINGSDLCRDAVEDSNAGEVKGKHVEESDEGQNTNNLHEEDIEADMVMTEDPSPRTMAMAMHHDQATQADNFDVYNVQDEELVEIFNRCYAQTDAPVQSETETTAKALEALVHASDMSDQHAQVSMIQDIARGRFDRIPDTAASSNASDKALNSQKNNNNKNDAEIAARDQFPVQRNTCRSLVSEHKANNSIAKSPHHERRGDGTVRTGKNVAGLRHQRNYEPDSDDSSDATEAVETRLAHGDEPVHTLFLLLADLCADMRVDNTSDTESDEVRRFHHGILFDEMTDSDDRSSAQSSSNPDVAARIIGFDENLVGDPSLSSVCDQQLTDRSDYDDDGNWAVSVDAQHCNREKISISSENQRPCGEKNANSQNNVVAYAACNGLISRSSISENFADDEVDFSDGEASDSDYHDTQQSEHNTSRDSFKSTVQVVSEESDQYVDDDEYDATLEMEPVADTSRHEEVKFGKHLHLLSVPAVDSAFGHWNSECRSGDDDDDDNDDNDFASCSTSFRQLHPERSNTGLACDPMHDVPSRNVTSHIGGEMKIGVQTRSKYQDIDAQPACRYHEHHTQHYNHYDFIQPDCRNNGDDIQPVYQYEGTDIHPDYEYQNVGIHLDYRLQNNEARPYFSYQDNTNTPADNIYRDADTPVNNRYEDIDTQGNNRYEDIDTQGNNRYEDIDTQGNNRYEDIDTQGNNRYEDIDTQVNRRCEDIDTQTDDIYEDIATGAGDQYETIDTQAGDLSENTIVHAVSRQEHTCHTKEDLDIKDGFRVQSEILHDRNQSLEDKIRLPISSMSADELMPDDPANNRCAHNKGDTTVEHMPSAVDLLNAVDQTRADYKSRAQVRQVTSDRNLNQRMIRTMRELRLELDEWTETRQSRLRSQRSEEEDIITLQIADVLPYLRNYCREKQKKDFVPATCRTPVTDHAALPPELFRFKVNPFPMNEWVSSPGIGSFILDQGLSVLVNILSL